MTGRCSVCLYFDSSFALALEWYIFETFWVAPSTCGRDVGLNLRTLHPQKCLPSCEDMFSPPDIDNEEAANFLSMMCATFFREGKLRTRNDWTQKTRWWQLKYVLFSPRNHGEMIQFDEHIFQMGWFNHQLENPSFQEIPSLPHPWINRCHWTAGGVPSSWSWSTLGLTSDFLCGGKSPGMRMTHHDLHDLYRRLYRFYFLGSVL